MHLNYSFLPCVVIRKENYLPMEVCNVIEGQRHTRKLNEKQTADMIKFTCFEFNGSGMKVSNEMAVVNARILPTPTLQHHQSSREASFSSRDGSWNLRDKKVATDTGINIPNRTPPILHANSHGDIEGSVKQAWVCAVNFPKVIL
ncbi:hypothetical protein C2G38_2183999 [Gigaspora rosea]|uniref:PAZ domain-containing protein n=1 Tax=Gigaspora rosea TaxID=44941 RepID=A0A397V801_9GLOM|nr:hypothetical protein C2G38_2183999 [Gigaspora rosea]